MGIVETRLSTAIPAMKQQARNMPIFTDAVPKQDKGSAFPPRKAGN
jgi:hypothetical protein